MKFHRTLQKVSGASFVFQTKFITPPKLSRPKHDREGRFRDRVSWPPKLACDRNEDQIILRDNLLTIKKSMDYVVYVSPSKYNISLCFDLIRRHELDRGYPRLDVSSKKFNDFLHWSSSLFRTNVCMAAKAWSLTEFLENCGDSGCAPVKWPPWVVACQKSTVASLV